MINQAGKEDIEYEKPKNNKEQKGCQRKKELFYRRLHGILKKRLFRCSSDREQSLNALSAELVKVCNKNSDMLFLWYQSEVNYKPV